MSYYIDKVQRLKTPPSSHSRTKLLEKTQQLPPGTKDTRAVLVPAHSLSEQTSSVLTTRSSEPLDSSHDGEDYDTLLPSLKRFFYLEMKLVDEKIATLRMNLLGSENEKSLLGIKAHLVSSYYLLVAQEIALMATTLTSLIEYTRCSAVSAALGILVCIEGSKEWTTIASFILFGLIPTYKILNTHRMCSSHGLRSVKRITKD
ncbi:hypothetical protein BU25DRAFT_457458 [Macroventuria anomochaeta]|uniref:Uncharacterized protein n=1 Tax=Macroventuria anomochaeta TaxID=301207 RepID=A0ACB6S3P2_9PLEO|nr:uncharacterized protein BU25DRAFT_457458 [Macroventuria anomochaeta]KAF2628653.1 hypothetical protein BU25DRAFT_457458 [Macroventuria anomochaeta]